MGYDDEEAELPEAVTWRHQCFGGRCTVQRANELTRCPDCALAACTQEDPCRVVRNSKQTIDTTETVNHPQHYGGDVPHEVIKCLEAWGLENDALLWNAVKYIARAGKKGDALEDLKKAGWYLARRIAAMKKEG